MAASQTTIRRCACGATATHQIDVRIPSNVGIATRTETLCSRCAERLAKSLLLDGARSVEVRVI